MPIQFQCQKCSKWLEVDEPHAGSKAVCPFCQAINDVPQATMARPAEAPVSPEDSPPAEGKSPYTGVPTEHTRPNAPDVPVSKPLERQRSGQQPSDSDYSEGWFDAQREGLPVSPSTRRTSRLATAGLVLVLVAWGLIIAMNIVAAKYAPADLQKQLRSPAEAQAFLQQHPWVMAAFGVILLAYVLGIVGLIVSLSAALNPRNPTKRTAWTGAIIGILLLLCTCAGMLAGSAI